MMLFLRRTLELAVILLGFYPSVDYNVYLPIISGREVSFYVKDLMYSSAPFFLALVFCVKISMKNQCLVADKAINL